MSFLGHRDWSVEDWKRIAWSDESLFLIATSHKSQLATGWLGEHSSDFSVINCLPRSPGLYPIEHFSEVLEQGVKGYHTAPTNLTELWTALANIWLIIPVELFQKLFESMPRRVAAVIKARGGPTRN
ncbi:transposable element Tcb2 transposase [Trichonephila clavipes]|nr:transposable element Tcb2 transposase [Trichonephila clavipes]